MSMIAIRPKAAPALAGAAFFMSAALLGAALLGAAPAQAAELDDFLGNLDECDFPAQGSAFARFTASLFQRYGNSADGPQGYAADHTGVVVVLPPELAAAFGAATSRNFGDYTLVTVPVDGTFGSLPLSGMTFSFGNQNGISAITLVFAASQADVAMAFGDSVERGDDRGQDAGRTGPGYSAEIPPGEPGRITCDWSS
ncbi:hypothetical protein [Xanthobacter sediminis]